MNRGTSDTWGKRQRRRRRQGANAWRNTLITLGRPRVMRMTKLHRICGCGDSSEERRQKSGPRGFPRGPRRTQMPLVGQRRPALPRTDSAVPSALGGLTSGFGMGPGVPPPPWPLTNEGHSVFGGPRRGVPWGPHSMQARRHNRPHRPRPRRDGRARPISAARLRRSRALHLRPIDLVVYQGPYRREDSSRDWLPA